MGPVFLAGIRASTHPDRFQNIVILVIVIIIAVTVITVAIHRHRLLRRYRRVVSCRVMWAGSSRHY